MSEISIMKSIFVKKSIMRSIIYGQMEVNCETILILEVHGSS